MDFLFNACAIFDGGLETVGDAFIERFRDRVGGDFHHSGLSASVMETNVMRNFIKKFGEELNLELENSNGDINGISIALGDTRPIFSSIYHQFHGLKILLNDTEHTRVKLLNYTFDQSTSEWEGDFYFEVIDHFGLDKADALKYQWWHSGFAAWWILQHKRGYVPFRTVIRINARIRGKIE